MNGYKKSDEIHSICICQIGNVVQDACDWLETPKVKSEYEFGCYWNQTGCYLTISDHFINNLFNEGIPQVAIEMKDGRSLTSFVPNKTTVPWSNGKYTFYIKDQGKIDPDDIEEIFMCKEACCVSITRLEDRGFFGLTGGLDCPDPNVFEVDNFLLNYGLITLDLIKQDGWEENNIGGTLNDALDRKWSGMDCERDSSDNSVMACTSTDSGITIKTGKASFLFDDGTFGASCGASLELEFPLPSWSPKKSGGHCSPGYHACPNWCCPDGSTCVPSGCL